MISKRILFCISIIACSFNLPILSTASDLVNEPKIARLIIYDTRGSDADETILVMDQSMISTKIWMKNYLGERRGEIPTPKFFLVFNLLRSIPEFALKPEYRGKTLRAHAAHGTITLAWQDSTGKHIKTIKYYAPEHNLDDFRFAFNSAWALSRYAILSLSSFESHNPAIREDALYFLAGSGWLTLSELADVVDYHRQKGNLPKLTHSIWTALDATYSASSDFRNLHYLDYCVRKSIVQLGPAALDFIQAPPSTAQRKTTLFKQIQKDLQGK